MVNAQTLNVIIGALITFFGGFILFALGLIVSYVRSMNKAMKEITNMTVKHEAMIGLHEKSIDKLFELHNKKRQHETA